MSKAELSVERKLPPKKKTVKEYKTEDKQVFLLALMQGFGFTEACEASGDDPQNMTLAMSQDPSILLDAKKAMRSYKVQQLKSADEYAKENKYDLAEKCRMNAIQAPALYLWGQLLTKEPIKPKAVVDAFLIVKRPKDVATALGMTYTDYVKYIQENGQIRTVVEQYLKVSIV